MRILFISGEATPSSTEIQYITNLGKGLAIAGHSLTVYTRDAAIVDSTIRNAGLSIRHLPIVPLFFWQAATQLADDLRQEAEECIIIIQNTLTATIATLAKKIARKPRTKLFLIIHKVFHPHVNFLSRILYASMHAIIFSSTSARRAFKEPWKHLPLQPDKLHAIHNSIWQNYYHPLPEQEKGPRIALYKGALTQKRGLEILFEALTLLHGKRIRLLMLGNGNPDYIDSLRQIAINAGIMDMITWKINPSKEETLDALLNSHFGVFPYGAIDAFGYQNIELMAAGRPQITTSTPVASEYLGPRSGALYVPPGDAPALACAIDELANNTPQRQSMGILAQQRFYELCNYQRFIERTTAVLLN